MAGRFIVIEGPDGAGTTVQSSLLAKKLREQGCDTVLTKEPSTGPVGALIREILCDRVPLDAASLQLLFVADRAMHLREVILPALQEGKTVVCDRYLSSTLAYGEAQGLNLRWLRKLNKSFIQPDREILLLPPMEVCNMRRKKRGGRSDLFEEEHFQRKVHRAYKKLSKENRKITVIKSSGSIEEVHTLIQKAVGIKISHRKRK